MNRVGGGGYIAAEHVVKAAPDGYTLMFTAANIVMSLELFPRQPVDPLKDFFPVSLLTKEPSLLAVHSSLPASSVKELIALARARPGEINYSSGGTGSSSHLNTELRARLVRDGALIVDGSTPEQFAAHMRDEKVKWARVVQVSGAAKGR